MSAKGRQFFGRLSAHWCLSQVLRFQPLHLPLFTFPVVLGSRDLLTGSPNARDLFITESRYLAPLKPVEDLQGQAAHLLGNFVERIGSECGTCVSWSAPVTWPAV